MTKLERIFLKYRWLIILFITIDFIERNAFYRNLVESSNELCDKIKVFFIKTCSFNISTILFIFIIIVYLIDFVLYDYKNIYETPILRQFFLVFFTLMVFVSELLFLPVYINFLEYSKPNKLNDRKLNIIRYAHFALMIFIATILISPINSPLIKQMDLLNSGIYYGTAYSEKEDKLFALNQGEQQLEVFSFKEQINKKVIYKSKLPKNNRWQIGHFINLNNDRNELYFTDREQNKLIILDTRDYSIKDTVQSEIFDYGDNFIDSANNDIFGITEENMCVYKISLMSKSHKMISKCFLDGEGSTLSLNKIKKQLYVFNWRTTTYKYSLYILDANDLN